MAGAKTAVMLPSQTVTATVTPIVGTGEAFYAATVALSGLAVRVNYAGDLTLRATYEEHGEPPEGYVWAGDYLHYGVKLQTPGTSPTTSVLLWLQDKLVPDDEDFDDPPDEYTVVTTFSVVCTLKLRDVFRTTITTEEPPPTREFMGYFDRRTTDKWATDAGSSWEAIGDWGEGSIQESGYYPAEINEYDDFPAHLGVSIIPSRADADTDQVVVTNWAYTGVGMTVSPAQYRPGIDNPDPILNEGWGRTHYTENYVHFTNGRLGIVGNMPGWTGVVGPIYEARLPVDVTFTPRTGKFVEEEGLEYAITVVGNPIEWTEDPPGTWSSAPKPFTGELRVQEQDRSWLYDYEWRNLGSRHVMLGTDGDWAAAHGEAGEGCLLLLHPINVGGLMGDPTGEWPALVTIGHEGDLRVIKPAGVLRPADWVGGNGATPDGGNNDLWHVAAASTDPYVSIDLASHKWPRLNRLAAHTADEDYKSAHLIKVNKANITNWPYPPYDYLDPPEGRSPENRCCWKHYTHLLLRINAPRAATLTITLNYGSILSMYDPCYVGFKYRFGTEGEFEYSKATRQATYEVAVPETTNAWSNVYIDLMVPATGTPVPDLYNVDSIRVDLPDTGEAEDWELDDLHLCQDPDGAHVPFYMVRMYDPADCLSDPGDPGDPEAEPPEPPVPATVGDYTAFAAMVEGKACTDIADGTEMYVKTEFALKQIQVSRHSPPNPLPEYLDYAKTLNLLSFELELNEGWSATDHVIQDSAHNKDGLGTKALQNLYWFDVLRHRKFERDTGTCGLTGAPITIWWSILGGVPYRVVYEKYLQGMAHGLAILDDRSDRCRSAGTVRLYYRSPAGEGSWHLVDQGVPNVLGHWELGPYKQEDCDYQIGGLGRNWIIVHGISPFFLRNVRYSLLDIISGPARYVCDLRRDYVGRCWVAAVNEVGLPFVARLPHCIGPLTDWVEVVGSGVYSQASIVPLPDSRLVLALHDYGLSHAAIFVSKDDGESWERLDMPHFLDDLELPDHAEMPGTGVLYGVGIDGAAVWVEWSDDQGASKCPFADASTRIKICDLVLTDGAPPASIEVMSDASLLVATADDDGGKFWCSRDRGENWSEVT